jgi:hypothetical protein
MKHTLAVIVLLAMTWPAWGQIDKCPCCGASAAPTVPSSPLPGSPTMPAVIPLPPAEFDHEYKGQLIITKWNDYSLIQMICKETTNAIACSYRTYDSISGKPISCLIMLGPLAHDNARVLQHEIGHCNGWSNKHEGAR